MLTLSLQLIISSDFSENSKNCEGHKYFWSFGFPSGPLRRTSIFEASQKSERGMEARRKAWHQFPQPTTSNMAAGMGFNRPLSFR